MHIKRREERRKEGRKEEKSILIVMQGLLQTKK